jgi:hypothetical protein
LDALSRTSGSSTDHGDAPHGIVYRSRFDDGSLSVVLFERARPYVRLLPSTAPVPLNEVNELADAVRAVVPFAFVPSST